MSSFNIRWQQAIKKIEASQHLVQKMPSRVASSSQEFQDKRNIFERGAGANLQRLKLAFQNNKFIYGTTGPKARHYGNVGNPAVRAAEKWFNRTKKSWNKKDDEYKLAHGGFKSFQRELKLYDPGPRVEQYIKMNCQMMDMYYGMDNDLYTLRNPVIAEFVHYVMGFSPEFDFERSGKDMYEATFPGEGPGWLDNARTTAAYGQSATKEMSKIIREGIKTWGGLLIIEGKAIYGASVFEHNARAGDTDLECQALFEAFYSGSGARVGYGKGYLEFHWGGVPTTPTKAHFLTNWNFDPSGHLHVKANQLTNNQLKNLFSPNHGLRPIWNNFKDFPGNTPKNPDMYDFCIGYLGEVSNFAYGPKLSIWPLL